MANQSIKNAFRTFWYQVILKLNNYATTESLDAHIADVSNPHSVTKEQIGLGNVDNTADVNKSVNYAATAGSADKAAQDDSGNVIVSTYETKSDANTKLIEAKDYADSVATSAANTVKNDLLNGAGEAYDTLKELGDLITDNTDALEALKQVASGKADASHTHTISDVDNLQVALDEKASSSSLSNYYTKTEVDNLELITTSDIDKICGITT